MKKLILKNRRQFGILFLTIYTSFVVVGIFHYHSFELSQKKTYSDAVNSSIYNDLISDFFSVCSLHQFSQTIDDYHYSSSDIVQSLSKIDANIFSQDISNIYTFKYSRLSPRAPPAII